MSYSVEANLRDRINGLSLKAQSAFTPTSTISAGNRIKVGTTEVNVNLSAEISPAAYVMFVNQGVTDTLQLGFATGVYPIQLIPGGSALFQLNAAQAANFFVISSGTADDGNFEYKVMSA